MPAASVVPASTRTPVRVDRRAAVAGAVAFAANAALLVSHAVAGRLLAPFVDSSLDTWTAVAAATLAGVAAGSAFGGRTTAGRPGVWLLVAAGSAVWVVVLPILLNSSSLHAAVPLALRTPVLAVLICLPIAFALGTLSPLAAQIGGRVVLPLAVAGGLTGSVAASLVLLPAFTLNQIVVGTAAVLGVLAAVVSAVRLAPSGGVTRRLHPALMPPELPPAPFPLSAAITWGATGTAAGVVLGTFVVSAAVLVPAAVAVLATVAVAGWRRANVSRVLCAAGGAALGGLMVLVNAHSRPVETDDAEPFPLEVVYAATDAHPDSQRVLVLGGGSTFPARVRERVPTAAVDVADHGRVFVAERAEAGVYHVVLVRATADAVPSHLLTRECNEAVKKTLTDDGVFLVIVRDTVDGRSWKAVCGTMQESFPHVAVTFTKGTFDPQSQERSVIVLYAAKSPLEPDRWAEMMYRQTGNGSGVYVVPADVTAGLLARDKPILLTDQYAPVDNLLMQVFRARKPGE